MKRNVLKKFAAAALAAATVMSSMSVMAFAADSAVGTEEKGSVTITKYMGDTTGDGYETLESYYGAEQNSVTGEKLKDVKFAYIEVGNRVQVNVEDSTNKKTTTEMLYTLTDNAAKALKLTTADVTENETKYYRMSTLDTAIRNYKKDAIDLVKTTSGNHATATDEKGTVEFSNLTLEKLYLFAETDATAAKKVSDGSSVAVTKVSVPFFVSLPFTDASGKSVKDIYAYPKNSTGTATIEKNIVEGTKEKVRTTANIGDTINYKVTYSIPVGENGLESLVVTDKMSKGLTFVNNADSIKVLNDDTEVSNTMYDVTHSIDPSTNDTTILIKFKSEEYCKQLAPNTTQNFTITYTATLNEEAVLGQTGNTNKVQLKYTNKGADEKTISPDPDKEVKVFTYGIDLTKKGEGTDVLEGVKFELTNSENQPVNVLKNGTNNFYTPGGSSNTVTTGVDGKIYIRGLKPGTYKLTETKTNKGYVLLKDPVVIVITPSTNEEEAATGVVTATVGGKAVTMNNDSNNTASVTAEVPLTVVNSKGFDLPATGGRGIALFTIAGIAIVAAAGSLLFMRKRSK